jgi:5-methylcytosine-specific restriction endonuclease McrA
MPTRPTTSRPARPPAGRAGERLTARQRGYTQAWDREARAFLSQHPLCYDCGLVGRVEAAQHVDHYNPTEPHTPAFYDPAHLRPACAYHNSQKRDTPGDEYVARILADHAAERGRAPQSVPSHE